MKLIPKSAIIDLACQKRTIKRSEYMLKIFKRIGKRELIFMLISIIFVVVQVWLDLKLPDYTATITKLISTKGTKIADLKSPAINMILCALGSLASAIIVGYFAANVAAGFSKKIRKEVFRKVGKFSMTEIKRFSTASLITRTTNDITQVQMFIAMGLQLLIKAPITAVWAICKISNKSWQWTAITGGAVVFLLVMIIILLLLALPKFKIVQKLVDNLNKVTREHLTGIRVVRAFNAEKFQEEKFEIANNDLTKTQMFTQRMMAIISPVMIFIMTGLSLAIYYSGAYIIDAANIADKINIFGDMVVFSSYAMQIVVSFMMLSMIFILYPRSSISANRINEVLESPIAIKPGKINLKASSSIGTVEFKNVSFKYPDSEEYMLKDISFKVNKGETIAFIGSTGSGKSTLINLIPRFYDTTDGEVLIDDIDVKDYDLEYLYKKIAYIPQKAIMFSGNIKYNVSYGESKKKATKESIKKAIKVAQAEDFVLNMDDKYDSYIAQGGTNISGGQKQRLAIARAIARDPEILIFDDSFSALDYRTDYQLRKELKKNTKGVTTLIVAQRIGTIKDADKIIVLDEGKMVGMGTHKELLKNCKIYKEIALSQLSEEELKDEK